MDEMPFIENEVETFNKLNLNLIKIEFNKNKYNLKLEFENDTVTFELLDTDKMPYANYIKTLNFNEIKALNKLFENLKTYNDFYEYLKKLSKDKKINIIKNKDKISIILFIDILGKQQEVNIDLIPEKKDFELRMDKKDKEITNLISKFESEIKKKNTENEDLKNRIKECSKENDELKNKIKECLKENEYFKEINKYFNIKVESINRKNDYLIMAITIMLILIFMFIIYIFYLKSLIKDLNGIIYDNSIQRRDEFNISVIMDKSEKKMIFSGIENKMGKKIKLLKKLYQASIDGGDPINFHIKCDNKPNTLVLIKSEGNRRFGGFTPISWEKEGGYIKDSENKTFVFSLDNKKIYYLKDMNYALYHGIYYGPIFGFIDIRIYGNPIKENSLSTSQDSYDYKGDKKSLSEYHYPNKIKALEYEVFQIIFD